MALVFMAEMVRLKPFSCSRKNREECINEVVVIICCYHLMLLSDFVPTYEVEFRKYVGFSMIIVTSLVALYFLFSIITSILLPPIKNLKKKY